MPAAADLERQARRKYSLLEKPIGRKRADSRGAEGRRAMAKRSQGNGTKATMKGPSECADRGAPPLEELIDMSR